MCVDVDRTSLAKEIFYSREIFLLKGRRAPTLKYESVWVKAVRVRNYSLPRTQHSIKWYKKIHPKSKYNQYQWYRNIFVISARFSRSMCFCKSMDGMMGNVRSLEIIIAFEDMKVHRETFSLYVTSMIECKTSMFLREFYIYFFSGAYKHTASLVFDSSPR